MKPMTQESIQELKNKGYRVYQNADPNWRSYCYLEKDGEFFYTQRGLFDLLEFFGKVSKEEFNKGEFVEV